MADLDLARQLVAAPWWRWEEGMAGGDRAGRFFRVVLVHPRGGALVASGVASLPVSAEALAAMLPDLTDAATAGVLLGWLPPGWAIESPTCDGQGTYVVVPDGLVESCRGDCLGEAVARALIAVGGRRG